MREQKEVNRPAVCGGCSCLCDDIIYSAQESSVGPSQACDLGKLWFAQTEIDCRNQREHQCQGQAVSLEAAVGEARRMLEFARMPLFVGLEGLCIESQRTAFRLADRWRGTIAVSLDGTGLAGLASLQRVGKVTATMGEVAQRADLVLIWFCDPVITHPRAWERFVRPEVCRSRRIVVISDQANASSGMADQFLPLKRSQAATALSVLRALLLNCRMNEQAVLEQTNHSLARWRELLGELLSSRYGAILSGSATDPQSHPEFDIAGEQLAWLVRALNDTNRFVTLEMRTDHNALGAENVLSWNSGFGENVNLNRGYPRSCFSEYSAATVLEEKSCDLIVLGSLIRAGEALSKLSANAAQQFMQTPKILLNETGVEPAFQPQVEFRVLRPGGAALGDFCRLDDVAIPMSVLWQQDHLPSAKNILEWLV